MEQQPLPPFEATDKQVVELRTKAAEIMGLCGKLRDSYSVKANLNGAGTSPKAKRHKGATSQGQAHLDNHQDLMARVEGLNTLIGELDRIKQEVSNSDSGAVAGMGSRLAFAFARILAFFGVSHLAF